MKHTKHRTEKRERKRRILLPFPWSIFLALFVCCFCSFFFPWRVCHPLCECVCVSVCVCVFPFCLFFPPLTPPSSHANLQKCSSDRCSFPRWRKLNGWWRLLSSYSPLHILRHTYTHTHKHTGRAAASLLPRSSSSACLPPLPLWTLSMMVRQTNTHTHTYTHTQAATRNVFLPPYSITLPPATSTPLPLGTQTHTYTHTHIKGGS